MNTEPNRPQDDNPEMQGEGNYTAARHYNEATKRFVDDDKVDNAAAAAKPDSPQEEREMERAEEEGKSHAKEEDPALRRGEKSSGDKPARGADRDAG